MARYRLISCRPNSERVSRLPTGFNNRCLESTVCKFISPPYYRGRLSFLYLRINEVFLPAIIGYGTAITAAVYGNFCLTLKGDVPRSKTQKYGICPRHFSRGSENSSKNAFARGANIPNAIANAFTVEVAVGISRVSNVHGSRVRNINR
ncbi:unnamed protein product [Lasius platythorax]|uniref:Uncharacterized protein n=1 Tax=Lasius platythorax TaxID=488582 RepID=A0AAV2NDS5_9HYME